MKRKRGNVNIPQYKTYSLLYGVLQITFVPYRHPRLGTVVSSLNITKYCYNLYILHF